MKQFSRSFLGSLKCKPPYLAVLVIITLAYLIVECAFNARLLDVAGGASQSLRYRRGRILGSVYFRGSSSLGSLRHTSASMATQVHGWMERIYWNVHASCFPYHLLCISRREIAD